MKQKVFQFLYHPNVHKFIYALIVLNVIALLLESYNSIYEGNEAIFNVIEIVSVVVFTIEYFARIWTIDLDGRFEGSTLKQRLKFIGSALGIIDLLAILPFYLPMFFAFDLRFVRILRLLRLLRIFKLGRFSKSMKTLGQVLNESKSELIVTLFVCFILLIFSSSLMYFIEYEAQPEKFQSIGDSIWWAVATLTTVGYGDIYPITGLGKFLAAIIALIGIGFVALPTGIISSAFIEKMQKKQREPIQCTCPNCATEFKVERT